MSESQPTPDRSSADKNRDRRLQFPILYRGFFASEPKIIGALPEPTRPETFWQRLYRFFKRTAALWVGLALVAFIAIAVVWALISIGQDPATQATLKPLLVSATATGYADDLNAFSVSYATGEPWEAEPSTSADCSGTIFALTGEGLRTQDPEQPRLRICFLEFASDHPGKPLSEYLSERLVSPMGLKALQPEPGLVTDIDVGIGRTSGHGKYLLGTDAESKQPTKWYVAVVDFEGRVYSVEAAATREQWDDLGPRFSRLIERIEFGSNVISPENTAVVID